MAGFFHLKAVYMNNDYTATSDAHASVPPVITRICGPVQELGFRIPFRHTEGKRQCILFPGLPDVTLGTEVLSLNATSDCGLLVYYYVKEGPAEVVDGKLVLTQIPPPPQ